MYMHFKAPSKTKMTIADGRNLFLYLYKCNGLDVVLYSSCNIFELLLSSLLVVIKKRLL